MFKTGLIVGKFCPLHKGHEHLIETALAACEHLVIISYAKPGYPGCETLKREKWLENLYPQTTRFVIDDNWLASNYSPQWSQIPSEDALAETHRQFTAWVCSDVLGKTPDVVFTSEDYGDGFAAHLSRYLSVECGEQKFVEHICIDRKRSTIPISGTLIRSDIWKYREFLSDTIYASFIKRAVLLGGESTGKTTLCEAAAKHMSTQFAAEYGRELWDEKGGSLAYDDLLHMAQTQIEREKSLAIKSREWLICDTSPLTTAFYSDAMFGRTDPKLDALANRQYDAVFLCDSDFEFVQDGTRQNNDFRIRQQKWYVSQLKSRNIPYTLLSSSLEIRLETLLGIIKVQTKH